MGNCTIHPIPLFELNLDKSAMTYRLDSGHRIFVPGYAWYIEGAKEKILVDAGCDTDYAWKVRRTRVRDIQTIDSGLSKLGLSLNDIDVIILTHFHHDHVGLAFRFPKARVLIQKDEFECVQNPHPSISPGYKKEFLEWVNFKQLNFEVINGDVKLCEEVSIIKTPGHTPGAQSVSIKTAQGIAVIAGACTIRDNFEPPPPITLPVIVPGIHINVFDAYDSLLRIKEMADIVLPLHDSRFLNVSSIP